MKAQNLLFIIRELRYFEFINILHIAYSSNVDCCILVQYFEFFKFESFGCVNNTVDTKNYDINK